MKNIQNFSKFLAIRKLTLNERIWKIALEIWKGVTSAMIARAFILAYRIRLRVRPSGLRMEHHIATFDEIIMILIEES